MAIGISIWLSEFGYNGSEQLHPVINGFFPSVSVGGCRNEDFVSCALPWLSLQTACIFGQVGNEI